MSDKNEKAQPVFLKCFGQIEDPRLDRQKKHKLIDIIAIAVCATIAGADGWVAVALYARSKEAWLRSFLELENGIPSHDTFGRVFCLLDPQAFQDAFRQWVSIIQGKIEGVVAIDGKTARGSRDRANGKQAIHIVSAWAVENGVSLGQIKVDDKSNEITAIPELLKLLDLNGCLVTIDAMGCQRDIAQKILDAGGDYLLAVKGNQETLAEDVEQEFKHAQADGFAHMDHLYRETLEKGHGRIEKRQYWYTHDVQGLGTLERWPKLNGMVMCRATRTDQGQTTVEDRYFITSATHDDVAKIADAIRAHWQIENGLHWVLDVAFGEDLSRIRSGYAAENIAAIRKIANNALKQCTSRKGGVKTKRLQAGWDDRFMEEILLAL
ncbi:MAG: ISAs1 family transposase [Sulfuricella denitrificans]|nr:ISAs1 family transposase [Sulfuricella denitrificans]